MRGRDWTVRYNVIPTSSIACGRPTRFAHVSGGSKVCPALSETASPGRYDRPCGSRRRSTKNFLPAGRNLTKAGSHFPGRPDDTCDVHKHPNRQDDRVPNTAWELLRAAPWRRHRSSRRGDADASTLGETGRDVVYEQTRVGDSCVGASVSRRGPLPQAEEG